MLKQLLLIAIVIAAGIGTSRLWPRHKPWALLLCAGAALLVVVLARHWRLDLSGVA